MKTNHLKETHTFQFYLLTTFLFMTSCSFIPKSDMEELNIIDKPHNLESVNLTRKTTLWNKDIGEVRSLMAADIMGDNNLEIISFSTGMIKVLDLNGDDLATFRIKNSLIPTLIKDMDDDGKEDILFSSDSDRNSIIAIYNGVGYRISGRSLTEENVSLQASEGILYFSNGKTGSSNCVYILQSGEKSLSFFKVENRFSDYELIELIDFEKESDQFVYNTEDPTCQTVEIRNGSLYLRAQEYSGFKSGAQARYKKSISKGSIIQFSVIFGDYFNHQHPFGHFNLLWKDPENRINFMTGNNWFGYFTSVRGEQIDIELSEINFLPGTAYIFEYHLEPDEIKIYLNDKKIHQVEYRDDLPEKGSLMFECHNEYWIDNLKVYIKKND